MSYTLPFTAQMRVLELGGGDHPQFRPNVDIRPSAVVDLVANLSEPLPIPDTSFDGVFSMYAIEHVSWRKVRVLLAEAYRLIVPGGVVVFVTANLLEQARALVSHEVWTDDDVCMIFGGQDYSENAHACGFSPESAVRMFRAAGFVNVTVLPHPNCPTDMIIEAWKAPLPKVEHKIVTAENVPKALREQYGPFDVDTERFLKMFLENATGTERILEVGANEEYSANVLAEMGYSVVGLDLREYAARVQNPQPCNYEFIRADLNNLPGDLRSRFYGMFDVVYSLSAIEHFGLGAYAEGKIAWLYDVIAMHTIWSLLKEGGHAYITVPYGKNFIEHIPHWRVYNLDTMRGRLVQDFEIGRTEFFLSGAVPSGSPPIGASVTREFADAYSGDPPHVTVLLELIKTASKRLAPDGR